jgi:hypothetical protein
MSGYTEKTEEKEDYAPTDAPENYKDKLRCLLLEKQTQTATRQSWVASYSSLATTPLTVEERLIWPSTTIVAVGVNRNLQTMPSTAIAGMSDDPREPRYLASTRNVEELVDWAGDQATSQTSASNQS